MFPKSQDLYMPMHSYDFRLKFFFEPQVDCTASIWDIATSLMAKKKESW